MAGKVSDQHATLQPVSSQEAFNTYVTETPDSTLKVIYFAAPWAAPCEHMSTVLSTLASTYPISTPPKAVFLSINTDDLPDIAEQFDVTAVPYVVLQKGNTTLETISGGDASKVRMAVEKHAGAGNASSSQLPPAQTVARPENQPAVNGGQVNGAPTGTNGVAATMTSQSTNDTPTNGASQEEDINSRLEKLVKAAPVMLFMKGTPSAPQCGFSRQLVGVLRENGVRYGFFNILADEDVRQGLKTFADWPTFPQLWVDGELVGGLDIVKEEVENDPDFFAKYSINGSKTEASNVPEKQPQLAAA